MTRAAPPLAVLGLALAGCAAAAPPPAELGGLWSAQPAGCIAGEGVRFRANAIEAVYAQDVVTLYAHPRYVVEPGAAFRVRIVYDLPEVADGEAGAQGVLVLERRPDGSIAPEGDERASAGAMHLVNDTATLLTLQPCGAHPWPEPLRGREA